MFHLDKNCNYGIKTVVLTRHKALPTLILKCRLWQTATLWKNMITMKQCY